MNKYKSIVLKAKTNFFAKTALNKAKIEDLMSFIVHIEDKNMRSHIAKAISLVEKMSRIVLTYFL